MSNQGNIYVLHVLKGCGRAAQVLLDTVFINTIDPASLALIVPVVARGLRDRSGDAKRKAARIVGNMCALINEPKVPVSALP